MTWAALALQGAVLIAVAIVVAVVAAQGVYRREREALRIVGWGAVALAAMSLIAAGWVAWS